MNILIILAQSRILICKNKIKSILICRWQNSGVFIGRFFFDFSVKIKEEYIPASYDGRRWVKMDFLNPVPYTC